MRNKCRVHYHVSPAKTHGAAASASSGRGGEGEQAHLYQHVRHEDEGAHRPLHARLRHRRRLELRKRRAHSPGYALPPPNGGATLARVFARRTAACSVRPRWACLTPHAHARACRGWWWCAPVFTTLSRYRKPVPNVTETQDFEGGSPSRPVPCLPKSVASLDSLTRPPPTSDVTHDRAVRIPPRGGPVAAEHAHRQAQQVPAERLRTCHLPPSPPLHPAARLGPFDVPWERERRREGLAAAQRARVP